MDGKYVDQIAYTGGLDRASYLRQIPAIRSLLDGTPIVFRNDVTILAGENGSGKSTILEAIAVACGFNPEGGTKNFNFSTNATHSPLGHCLTVSKTRHEKDGFFLRAEGFYNLATNIEELDSLPAASPLISESYGGRSLHAQSHGESFLAAVQNRFSGKGLYILDEPEAALSPMKQMTLLCEIRRLADQVSQFILATHSPILTAIPGAEIIEIVDGVMKRRRYEELSHIQFLRLFLERPERMFR